MVLNGLATKGHTMHQITTTGEDFRHKHRQCDRWGEACLFTYKLNVFKDELVLTPKWRPFDCSTTHTRMQTIGALPKQMYVRWVASADHVWYISGSTTGKEEKRTEQPLALTTTYTNTQEQKAMQPCLTKKNSYHRSLK